MRAFAFCGADFAEDEIMTITAIPEMRHRLATNLLGGIAVARVVLRAMEKGWAIFEPMVECRYDLILDDGLKLYRVQVKYAGGKPPRQASGVIPVSLKKWRPGGRRSPDCYRASEIDALVVYVRKIDQLLWFGPEIFEGRRRLFIRVESSRNGQQKGCLMAADYFW
jgi:hypothetical protein